MTGILLLSIMAALATTGDGAALTVTVGDGAAVPVVFAAEELGRYLAEASGITTDLRRDAKLGGRDLILLGTTDDFSPDMVMAPQDAHEEAWRIHRLPEGGRAFTGNSPRAVLYGVYSFLEAEIGYRWYFPYPEDAITPNVAPEHLFALLDRETDTESHPAFAFREREFRDVSPTTDATDMRIVQQIDWWAKLRMNHFLLNFNYAANPTLWERWRAGIIPEIKRRGMLVGLGEHGSYPLFLPPARYARDHPDWYCELDGERIGDMYAKTGEWAQFCTTNPEAVAAYLVNFAQFIRDHPEIDFYYPAPNDVGRWCECATCRDLPIADRYLRLNNQTAEMIDEIRPGTRVIHLAYSNHRLPPENTAPHPNVDIDVASWGRDLSYPLCDPRTMPDNPEYLEVFNQWSDLIQRTGDKSGARLIYHCKLMRHYWLGMHLLPLSVIDADFDCARELALDGFDFPLGFLGIWTKALNAYVVAQKCWDPDVSALDLTERFMEDYYGVRAETARRVYRLAAEAFRDRRYGRSRALAWFPDTIKVRETPLEGLGDNARHAVARLNEAIDLLDALPEEIPPLSDRLQKLRIVLRHARDEQQVLVALDGLMHAWLAFRDEGTAQARQKAMDAWRITNEKNEVLEAAYSLEEDVAGLYWAGASYRFLGDALADWRLTVEGYDWQIVGTWETDDFQDSTAPVVKVFDVSDILAEGLAEHLLVQFRYTGGELGISSRAASLWIVHPDNSEALLFEDRHGGMAGYIHENAVYRLDPKQEAAPGTRFLLKTELAALTNSGRVAARGCRGDILIGLPPQDKEP